MGHDLRTHQKHNVNGICEEDKKESALRAVEILIAGYFQYLIAPISGFSRSCH